MNNQSTGSLICKLRKEKGMTQRQIADLMNISDRTISKWERGLGCPDVSLLVELSQILNVNIEGILSGEINQNQPFGGNMNKLKFYVCPQCGNIITAANEAEISCCGKKMMAQEAKKADENHQLNVEPIEDELFVTTNHEMTKEHYISFVAFLTGEKLLLSRQYPEWNLQLRLQRMGHGRLYFYCNKHGLNYQLL